MIRKSFLSVLILSILAMAPSVYAGKVELTTYYPAPYGEYKEIKTTEKADLATTSGNVHVGSATNPTALIVNNVLTLDPVDISAGAAGGTAGSLCYSTNAGGAGVSGMLYSNGAAWKSLGGAARVVKATCVNLPVGSAINHSATQYWDDFPGVSVTIPANSLSTGKIMVAFHGGPIGRSNIGPSIIANYSIVIDGATVAYRGDINTDVEYGADVAYIGNVDISNAHTIKVQWKNSHYLQSTLTWGNGGGYALLTVSEVE
jgi:hypothetical protein